MAKARKKSTAREPAHQSGISRRTVVISITCTLEVSEYPPEIAAAFLAKDAKTFVRDFLDDIPFEEMAFDIVRDETV